MSGFVAQKKFETLFDGDTVTYIVAAPTMSFLQKLSSFISPNDDGSVKFAATVDSLTKLNSILPLVVSEFGGLKDAGGGDISLEQACTNVYFAPLVKDVLVNIFSMTQIGAETEKKLGEQ